MANIVKDGRRIELTDAEFAAWQARPKNPDNPARTVRAQKAALRAQLPDVIAGLIADTAPKKLKDWKDAWDQANA